jgi:hypothetical protein
MTKLGKILVFLNLVISGLMAGWALALYTNYIDWSEAPPKGVEPGGLLGQRKERIKELQAALGPPQVSWMEARTNLHRREDQRQGDLLWYQAELQHLRTGATRDNPCRLVVIPDDPRQPGRHLPVPDPKNFFRPQMAPAQDRSGQPLQALDKYEKISRDTLEKLMMVLSEAEAKYEEDRKLTNLMVGEEDKGIKGLQQRIIDERAKREGILAEQRVIEPLWKVNEVDTELLLRRRETIAERLNELKVYLKRRFNYEVAKGR